MAKDSVFTQVGNDFQQPASRSRLWPKTAVAGWRKEVFPDFSSTTPEEKWKSGRWSPGKVGGEEEEKLLFL